MKWLNDLTHAIWLRLVGPEGISDRQREEETYKVLSEAQKTIERVRKNMEHPVFRDWREGDGHV